jgi:hypothetical protein
MATVSAAIGVDLGGTSIKAGVMTTPQGEVLHSVTLPTIPPASPFAAATVKQQLMSAVRTLLSWAAAVTPAIAVHSIGIGSPGVMDAANRVVVGGAENLPEWIQVPLADEFEVMLFLACSDHCGSPLGWLVVQFLHPIWWSSYARCVYMYVYVGVSAHPTTFHMRWTGHVWSPHRCAQ